MPPHLPTTWTSRQWLEEVEAWIDGALTSAGLERSGPTEQPRVRVWSTLLTVPTSGGLLWFKENHPGQLAEAAVVAELARLVPDHVAVPLAVERTRGWLLTPDHGATLSTLDARDETLWIRVVVEFADVQQRVAPHGASLLAAGLAPLLPSTLAAHVERRIEEMRALGPEEATYIPPALAERALAALPQLRRVAELLTESGPALTSLEHNDLHPNNVFIPRPDEPTLRFFDFGDSVWAHPFTSLAVPVGVLAREWETDPSDPRIARVIDGYLDAWRHLGSADELRATATLARMLWPVHRFESWRRLLAGSTREGHEEESEIVQYWLGRVADIRAP